jgi:LCP family protein required for cell wall assembly
VSHSGAASHTGPVLRTHWRRKSTMPRNLDIRAFVERFFMALLVTTIFTGFAIGAAYWRAAERWNDATETVALDPGTLDDVGRGEPANFLIIGSDTRDFVEDGIDADQFGTTDDAGGQRSDTIMIAHIDPETETGMLVSFPRDLWVNIPDVGEAKLNAAFNGGPQRVIQTIQENFDIEVNHYLEIDFNGFRNIVDAIGSVPIFFPTPARDTVTGLLVTEPGCQNLDGAQALAYARSRQYEYQENGEWVMDGTADLGRIRRQQYFLRSLARETVRTSLSNFTKIDDILGETFENLKRDEDLGLNDVRALARTFREVDPAVVEMLTVPTAREFIRGQDAQVLVQAEAEPIFERLRNFGEQPAAGELPDIAPADVLVGVLNGSGVSGQAGRTLDALGEVGFGIVEPADNADRTDYAITEVRYTAGNEGPAQLVLAYLGGAGNVVEVEALDADADVVIVLGADFDGVSVPTTAPATAAPATEAPAAAAPTTVSGLPANPGGDQPEPAAGC